MGRHQRKRSKALCAKAMAWAGVISTVLSAAVYLGDFITTIMTLRAYYHYQFICPHALPSSFRHDSVCRAVHLHPSLYNLGIIFWYSFGWFVLGHLSNAVVFYYFFHHHIASIAFFMPLVQLYRLLCILRRTCNTERLNEFYERQKRLNGLYTFLVVALESAPQFGLQFFIAVSLGQYVRGSNDTDSQAQKVPKTLVISVILSFASVIYNGGVAMYSCLDHHPIPLIKRLSLTFVLGLQTVISVFEHMISVLALFPHDTHSPLTFPIYVLLFTEIVLLFVFSSIVIQRHDQHEGKSMCTKFMQAIGLTLVMIWTGPSYMLILMQKSKAYVICGAFVSLFGKLPCPIFVFLWHKGFISPCSHVSHAEGMVYRTNRYLNCMVVKGAMFVSILMFALTSLTVTWVYKQEAPPHILGDKHGSFPLECRIPMRPDTVTPSTRVMKAKKASIVFKHFIFLLTFLLVERFKKQNLFRRSVGVCIANNQL